MNENDNIDEIRRDIEDTRQRISSEIEALEGKLTPAHAKEVVTNNVKERMVETKERFVGSVHDRAAMVRDNASRIGTDIVSTARANPIPLAMIGVGAGWLVWEMVRPRRDVEIEVEPLFDLEGETGLTTGTFEEYAGFEEVGTVGDDVSVSARPIGTGSYASGAGASRVAETKERLAGKAGEVKDRAKHAFEDARLRARDLASSTRSRASSVSTDARERANQLALRSKERVQHGRDVTTEAYDANPIAFGALALAAGIGLAMALPRTRREDELLGRTHGQVMDRAKHLVEGAKTVAADAVREGASAAKETAKREIDEGRLSQR